MEAVLYILHGSRVKEACNQATSFITKCMEGNKYSIQEYAFLELAEPSIERAFESCVEQGATIINVIPVLLLTAAHAKHDIPEVLDNLCRINPSIIIRYGRPIGVHSKMIEIVSEKIRQSSFHDDNKLLVLLVGRGSSDPDVKQDLGKIAQLIEGKFPGIQVKDCYLTAAKPSFEDGIKLANNSVYKNVLVIPYLLFTGILMNSMKKTMQEKADSKKQFELSQYLGYHPLISDILAERLAETAEGIHSYVSING